MTTIFILNFILIFIVLIAFAVKIKNHFSYYKIFHPDKLDKYNSYMDWQTKFSFDYTFIRFKIFLPFFLDREIEFEKGDHNLTRFANKINKSCFVIYSLVPIIVGLFIMISVKGSSDMDYRLETRDFNVNLIHKLKTTILSNTQSDSKILQLNSVMNFDWDYLLIIPPYCNIDKVSEEQNVPTKQISKTNIHMRDDINVLAFYKDTELINYIEFPRYPGDFSNNPTQLIRRENARFSIIVTDEKNGVGDNWIKIELLTNNP